MNKVFLFTGAETFNWQLTDFDKVIAFCKQYNIDGIIVKVYEVTQGEWYKSLGGASAVTLHVIASGLEALPYGFFYGGNRLPEELFALDQLLNSHMSFCLNLESDWDANSNQSITPLVDTLQKHPENGIYISTWANVVDHQWISNILQLDPYIAGWMPEEYNDKLIGLARDQWPTTEILYPTFAVGAELLTNIAQSAVSSLWEWQSAQLNPSWVDLFVKQMKGLNTVSIVTNSFGEVLDVPFSYQIEIGESQELCGNYGVATLALSGLPNKGNRGTTEEVDQMADYIATQWNKGPVNEQGSTISDMYNYLTVVDNHGNRMLHFQQISTDEARIKRALSCGYPVLVTANEQNIRSTKTGARPPYPWNINANHVIPIVGIDSSGNYIVADYLNNLFQGEWPCHYDAAVLQPSWACVIQVVGPDPTKPWLATIPNGDPLTWPSNFNAQLFAQGGIPLPSSDQSGKQFTDIWTASVGNPGPSRIFQVCYGLRKTIRLMALKAEVSTVDWVNNPIQSQELSGGFHAEWSHIDHKTRIYDMNDKLYGTY